MEFYIEERQGVDVLVFETSCRPAADTEVSMWKKIKDLEQKLASLISSMDEMENRNINLREKLAESEKKLADSEKREGELKDRRLDQLEMLEVVRFYGNPKAWTWHDFECDYSAIQSDDVEWARNANENAEYHYEGVDKLGGKRAREFLKKHGQEKV